MHLSLARGLRTSGTTIQEVIRWSRGTGLLGGMVSLALEQGTMEVCLWKILGSIVMAEGLGIKAAF